MAKLRPYIGGDPLDWLLVLVHHIFSVHPFEAGAYHTIYPYTVDDMPPATWSYHTVPVFDSDPALSGWYFQRGLLICRAWAALPWMMHDLCGDCHYLRSGPHMPRWNIARGGHKLSLPPGVGDYDARLIRNYVQKWDDPAPPDA